MCQGPADALGGDVVEVCHPQGFAAVGGGEDRQPDRTGQQLFGVEGVAGVGERVTLQPGVVLVVADAAAGLRDHEAAHAEAPLLQAAPRNRSAREVLERRGRLVGRRRGMQAAAQAQVQPRRGGFRERISVGAEPLCAPDRLKAHRRTGDGRGVVVFEPVVEPA